MELYRFLTVRTFYWLKFLTKLKYFKTNFIRCNLYLNEMTKEREIQIWVKVSTPADLLSPVCVCWFECLMQGSKKERSERCVNSTACTRGSAKTWPAEPRQQLWQISSTGEMRELTWKTYYVIMISVGRRLESTRCYCFHLYSWDIKKIVWSLRDHHIIALGRGRIEHAHS